MNNLIYVFDTNFQKKGIIQNYITLAWEEEYQGKGLFLFVCNDSQEYIDLLQENFYLFKKDKNTAMIIRYIEFDSLNKQIVVKGFTTLDLINQRVVVGEKIIKNVEQGMYSLIQENTRGLQYLTTSTIKNMPAVFESSFNQENLLDAEKNLAIETNYGFFMKFDYKNNQHIFTVYEGVDRSYKNGVNQHLIFCQEFGNLTNLTILNDSSQFKNVAYVYGEGEGANRKLIIVNDNITGNDRFEMVVDARDLQKDEGVGESEYEQLLYARGVQKLNENNKNYSFVAEINTEDFGKTFFLGDKVTCKSSKYKIQLDTTIMHYAEVFENNKKTIQLTLSEPILNIYEGGV